MKLKLEPGTSGEWDSLRIVTSEGVELPAVRSVSVMEREGQMPVVVVEFVAGDDFDVSAIPRPVYFGPFEFLE